MNSASWPASRIGAERRKISNKPMVLLRFRYGQVTTERPSYSRDAGTNACCGAENSSLFLRLETALIQKSYRAKGYGMLMLVARSAPSSAARAFVAGAAQIQRWGRSLAFQP